MKTSPNQFAAPISLRQIIFALAMVLVMPFVAHADLDLAARRLLIALTEVQLPDGTYYYPNYNKYFDPQLPLPSDGSQDAAFNALVDSYVNVYGFDQFVGASQILAVAELDHYPRTNQFIQGILQQGEMSVQFMNTLYVTNISTAAFQFPVRGQQTVQPNLPTRADVERITAVLSPPGVDVSKELATFQHAGDYLVALRTTPGALAALQKFTGILLPASGPLDANQISFLFGLLYDGSGNPTLAYTNPVKAAQDLVSAASPSQTAKYITAGLLGILALIIGILGFKMGFGNIPWEAWLGIAGAAALIITLYLMFGKKTNQNLGAGDAPAMQAQNASVVEVPKSGSSTSTTSASNTASNPGTNGPNSSTASVNPVLNSGISQAIPGPSANGTSSSSSGQNTLGATGTNPQNQTQPLSSGTMTQKAGPFDPAHAYISFYLPTTQGPTGLAANAQANTALSDQKTNLAAATASQTSVVTAVNDVRRAAADDKTVSSIQVNAK